MSDTTPQHDDPNKILRLRRAKLKMLREAGVNPFLFLQEDDSDSGLIAKFDSVQENKDRGRNFLFQGGFSRFALWAKQRFVMCVTNLDRCKSMCRRTRLEERGFRPLQTLRHFRLDSGVRGTAFVTKTGEPSLRALEVTLLSKSVYPLPVVKVSEDGRDSRRVHGQGIALSATLCETLP